MPDTTTSYKARALLEAWRDSDSHYVFTHPIEQDILAWACDAVEALEAQALEHAREGRLTNAGSERERVLTAWAELWDER